MSKNIADFIVEHEYLSLCFKLMEYFDLISPGLARACDTTIDEPGPPTQLHMQGEKVTRTDIANS